jgi:hypothetical protein
MNGLFEDLAGVYVPCHRNHPLPIVNQINPVEVGRNSATNTHLWRKALAVSFAQQMGSNSDVGRV